MLNSETTTEKIIVDQKLNIEFSRLSKIKNKVLEGQEGLHFGFTLSKNNRQYTFLSQQKEQIKSWIKFLNNIVLRVKVKQSYRFGKLLGQGSFAKVHVCKSYKSTTVEKVAIKSIYKTKLGEDKDGIS